MGIRVAGAQKRCLGGTAMTMSTFAVQAPEARGVSVGICLLSIVVPTRNEASNVRPLIERLTAALAHLEGEWEVIFVDDSDDTTPEVVAAVAGKREAAITLWHRPLGRRDGGLGGAVRDGFALARGDVIVVMDGDLQHPPEVLPALVAPAVAGRADLVAGSRYGGSGGAGGLSGPWRRVISRSAKWLAHRTVVRSRPLEDPLSGLFCVRRSVIDDVALQPIGYKILLEVAARGNWRTACNVPYVFARRYSGNSKASLREGVVFLRHLVRLRVP